MKRILLLLFLPLSLMAQVPDPKPNTYVNDFTNSLNSDQVKELNDSIQSLENRTSVEIAIVLVNHTDIDIADYALQLGRKWHVGNAGNGIVYVAAIDDHKQRLEIGSHVEGNIPDATAYEITNDIKPYFRSSDWFGGLQTLLQGIKEHIDPAAMEQLKLLREQRALKDQRSKEVAGKVLMYFGFAAGLFFLLWWLFLRPYYERRRKQREEERKRWEERSKIYEGQTYTNRQHNLTPGGLSSPPPPPAPKPKEDTYIPPPIISTPSPDNDSYSSRSSSDDSSSGFSFGGNDSFSGGGSTNDW